MIILVVVYNLQPNDYAAQAILRIENAISKTISEFSLSHSSNVINPAMIDFTFPQDPSVDTNDVPVWIIVEGLKILSIELESALRMDLAKKIAEAFEAIPENESRKVRVIVRRSDADHDGYYSISRA